MMECFRCRCLVGVVVGDDDDGVLNFLKTKP